MTQKPLAEYTVEIPRLSEDLNTFPEVKALFDDLTPGYQREWARYIYGAKAEATRQRHFDEMGKILLAGYKSKRGYAQRQ